MIVFTIPTKPDINISIMQDEPLISYLIPYFVVVAELSSMRGERGLDRCGLGVHAKVPHSSYQQTHKHSLTTTSVSSSLSLSL